MSDIERRYRTVLLWYPASWREQNADVVVGTLLDEADAAGRSEPRAAELASLAVNGLRARAGLLGRVLPIRASRSVVADLALALGFIVSLVMAVGFEWAPWVGQTWREWSGAVGVGFGPFASAGIIVFALWIVGFGIALAGFRTIASAVASLSVPLGVVFLHFRPDGRWAIFPPTRDGAFALVPTLGALLFFGVLAAASFLAPRVPGGARKQNVKRLLLAAVVAVAYVFVAIGSRSGWSLSSHEMFQFPGYEGRLWRSAAWVAVADVPLLAAFAAGVVLAGLLVALGWGLRGRSKGSAA